MNRAQYEAAEQMRLVVNYKLMENGVVFDDVRTAYIDPEVRIGSGSRIGSCVTITGETQIGRDCVIWQNSRIENSKIGDGTVIRCSVILCAEIGAHTEIGPFAYLRPGSRIGDRCRVGDFVEVKNSSLGDGSKASHLTYIGDADVGRDVNIGCGVVFVNYDGREKHRAVVEDGAFIGCNTNLVAPLAVGKGAYIGAGSTVTQDVPEGALYVARAKGRTFENWVKKSRLLD